MKVKEKDIQRQVVRYCRANDLRVQASASGIYHRALTFNIIAMFKSLGIIQERGYPDLFISHTKRDKTGVIIYAGLFIELKTTSGSVSSEQKEMLARLETNGYKAVICRSFEEAKSVIDDYFTKVD